MGTRVVVRQKWSSAPVSALAGSPNTQRTFCSQFWAVLFFVIFVLFMFFVVLNVFLAILNDAYTNVQQTAVWEQLDKRKPLTFREWFEVRGTAQKSTPVTCLRCARARQALR